MDQDSRSSESRERALSSELSSTRPNPFYDDQDDLSARKRRRTSPSSASRSRSVETVKSQDDPTAAASAFDSNMKIDSPEPESEPVLPSTPARPEQPTEPVSSRVTLNLRNADSLEATPASPTSPTPAKFRPDNVQAGVEETAVRMARAIDDGASSPLEPSLASPQIPVISIEDDDDDEIEAMHNESEPMQFDDRQAAQLAAHLADFPYRAPAEATHDTLRRLINYFQHGQYTLAYSGEHF